MRRKTTAKRLLNNAYEGYQDQPQHEAIEHRPSKMRKQLHPIIGREEEIRPCDAAPLKLISRTFEIDNGAELTIGDGDITMEVLGNLQTCSRAELIAMVLSMQKETDNLREQIKTLTACGRLAQNLEELVTKSDGWLNCCSVTTSPSIPGTHEGNFAPGQFPSKDVKNDRWVEHEGSSQQGCGQERNAETLRSETTLYQEFIPAELLERCNTGTTAQKLTNELLRGLYDRDRLASHSISGAVNSKRGQPKPALPAHEIQAILRAVQHYFPGKTDSEIKGYIRQKLQNEAKRLRKKPHPCELPLVGP
ncbi:proline-rich protein 15-like protein A [Brachyhypopomus gauderio]|uniref:proline-rich protein 15-like protein A n=1 Tax=Brachyhypopomus gauderio TaxID=698409 RepID=UPI0040417071